MSKSVYTTDFQYKTVELAGGYSLSYRLYLPEIIEGAPLLLCLHGAGERGNDNEKQLGYFMPILAPDASPARDAVVMIPQCPDCEQWVNTPWDLGSYSNADVPISNALNAVMTAVGELISTLPIDKTRIYITGLSMGGYGTWYALANFSHLFAAGLPLCGGGAPDMAVVLSKLPIRAFHGTVDSAVPVKASRDMAAAITSIDNHHFSYTEWPDMDHGIWGRVYDDPQNIEWLFAQHK